MTLPPYVTSLISKIEDAGFEVYPVGGCVRDTLMGKAPCDWDLATSAQPEEIQSVFNNQTVIPTGIHHGTVTVLSCGIPVEITTFRIDGNYLDNRHPENVSFSKNIYDDLSRRDFTINAMAYNPKTGLIDPFDGQSDLKRSIIRAVGDPKVRFTEDALRIMRAIRFAAYLDFEIAPDTHSAIFNCRELLKNISAERITAELTKTLTSKTPGAVLSTYFAATIQRFFSQSPDNLGSISFSSLDRVSNVLPLRLALYLILSANILKIDVFTLMQTFFSNLKFDNKTKSSIRLILKNFDTNISADKISMRKKIFEVGADTLNNILCIKEALQNDRHLQSLKQLLAEIIASGDCLSIKDLEVSGDDLIREFNLQGKEIGTALKTLLTAVIEDKCPNQKAELLEFYKSIQKKS